MPFGMVPPFMNVPSLLHGGFYRIEGAGLHHLICCCCPAAVWGVLLSLSFARAGHAATEQRACHKDHKAMAGDADSNHKKRRGGGRGGRGDRDGGRGGRGGNGKKHKYMSVSDPCPAVSILISFADIIPMAPGSLI